MKIRNLLISIFLFFCIFYMFFSYAAAADSFPHENILITDIREKSAALKSISSTFTQTKKLSLFKQPIVFHGNLALTRPDKLRWEFTDPVPSVLIFNGNKGLRCTKGNKPAPFDLQSDPIMQMVAEQLWIWLEGDYAKLQKDYLVKQTGESTLQITPLLKQTEVFIKSITIIFDEISRQPTSVTIAEPAGDKTVIEFNEHQLDPILPEKLFIQCYGRD